MVDFTADERDVAAGAEWGRRWGEQYLASHEIERLDARAESEAEAVWRLLELAPGATVVDAPCGFGRHAVRLAAWGYRVHGVDEDAELVAEARRRADASGVDCTLDVGDIRALPLPDGSADAVCNLASSVGLFDDDAENRRVLDEAFRVLRPGGALLIETDHRDAVVRRGDVTTWDENDDGTVVAQRRHFDVVSGCEHAELLAIAADGTRTRVEQRLRVFSLTELTATLHAVGFDEVRCHGGWDGRPPTAHGRAVLVARR